ncbi:hypothetical protein GOODEAATRI_026110 [Goodea atripinnis]|uniref:Uncharacterized protein n=1 Tax=Goodea atripinnis TaxID=208336 RepID=A0ABV0PH72_9TELE
MARHRPSSISVRIHSSISLRSYPGLESPRQPHTITVPPPCFTIDMFFFLIVVLVSYKLAQHYDVMGGTFGLSGPQNIFLKAWGLAYMFFFLVFTLEVYEGGGSLSYC